MKKALSVASMVMLVLSLTSCGNSAKKDNESQSLASAISIDGSGTVFPVSEAVAEEFLKIEPTIKVTVGESGTGGGFKKFGTGSIDISDASREIKDAEMVLCKENGIEYIKLTVALDGISVVINKENTWAKTMTTAELKKLWEPDSKVKLWSDIRKEWPKQEIHLYGPNTSHGTYDFFTEVIMGKSGASRTDYNAVSDYNVAVQGIEKDINSLGYFGLSYYEENKDKLGVVGIDNGKGAVLPSLETVSSNDYAPLSRSLYIYVNKKSAQKPEVQKFVNFYLDNAPQLCKEVGYVPMLQAGYDEQKLAFSQVINK